MKQWITIMLALVLAVCLLSACNTEGGVVVSQPDGTQPASSSSAPADKTDAPAIETEAPIGTLDSYVKTAKEATQSFSDGNTVTYRLPEILLDSADADNVNKEIMDRFGDECKTYDDYSPVSRLDYEAYLYDKYLSVLVSGKFDGGNTYGLCYTFDVTTGSLLNNETLCSMIGVDYNNAISSLTANVTKGYDESYGNLPGNDSERSKTLDNDNISASKMYLNEAGNLMAMVELYAAVGGGHWVDSFSAE